MIENRGKKSASLIDFKLSDKDFLKLGTFITRNWGIKMPVSKKTMLEGRLRKRLFALKLNSYKEYCEYLFSNEGQKKEIWEMIDIVSTNKTDFFREADHFEFLAGTLLPKFYAEGVGVANNPLRIWSAGCSSGEEPWTLAMVLSEFASKNKGFCFSIHATDISSTVLKTAKLAIYQERKITPIPMNLRKKYLLKARATGDTRVRFVPEIRKKVTFERLNLMQLDELPCRQYNIIFCRNVIIYFDKDTQAFLLKEFFRRIIDGGYLFLGHSEALAGNKVPIKMVAPMVYQT